MVEPKCNGNRMLGMTHIYGSSSFNDHYNIESKVMQVLDSGSSTSKLTLVCKEKKAYNPNTTALVVDSTNNDVQCWL